MAGMGRGAGGFLGGLVNGYAMGDELETNAAKRKRDEMESKRMQGIYDEEQRARDLRQAREDDVRAAMGGGQSGASTIPPNPMVQPSDTGVDPAAAGQGAPAGQPDQPKQIRPFDALISAASRRLAAGDVEGYADLVNKGTAAKTLYYTTTFNDAYRRGDVNGMLGVLNDFPDGNKYSVSPSQNGGLTATLMRPDGTVLGSKDFANERELGAFIQQKINPGDIAKTVREDLKAKSELALRAAQADHAKAAAGQATAQTGRINQLLPGEIRQQGAELTATNARADASRASAEASREQKTSYGMGEKGKMIRDLTGARDAAGNPIFTTQEIHDLVTGAGKGKAREQAIIDLAGKLGSDVTNSGLTTDQLVQKAASIVDGAAAAAGTSRVGSGMGGRGPGAPTANDPLQQARDAIAKGASRDAVIQRLKQNGIDPKGL